jgi:hypothetical protein
MLRASGFEPIAEYGPYSIPFGPAHPPGSRHPRWVAQRLARRVLTGNDGVVHHAILAS